MRLLLSRGPWIILLTAAAAAGLLAGNPGKDATSDRIAALIKQLGHKKYARREAAARGLEALGEKALPALRNAAGSDILEMRRRAEILVSKIVLATRRSKSIGLVMTPIDAGAFTMGSRVRNETQHRVRISRPFLLGVYEVTQDEYRKVMKTNPSWFASTGGGKRAVEGMDTGRFPVEQVSWFDAVAFCNRLSQMDGYEPYYKLTDVKREGDSIRSATVTVAGGHGYRLPTEAEWEYACRAGTNTPYHYGFQNTGREANLKPEPDTGAYGAAPTWKGLGRMTRVGSYTPNQWGLCDMHGNAAEWCGDWYDANYYQHSPAADPKGPDTGHHRVQRGGSWLVTASNCRSTSRFWRTPDDRSYFAGFRVARTP